MYKLTNKTGILVVTLINVLVIGCSCFETPEEKELKKLAEEEKKLVEGLAKKYNMSPDGERMYKNDLERIKKLPLEKIDLLVSGRRNMGNGFKELNSKLEEAKKDPSKIVGFLSDFHKALKDLGVNPLKVINNIDDAESLMLDEVNRAMRTYSISLKFENWDQISQYMDDELLILEKVQKQVELKNKGKKAKGGS